MDNFILPDGRQPIRFAENNAAIYKKARGEGEVYYTFSMIRYIQKHRPRLTTEERSRRAKNRAELLKARDPQFFNKLGTKGGKVTKKDRAKQ